MLGATGASWIFVPASSGIYTVSVNVTDLVAVVMRSNVASVTVDSALSVSVSPSPAVIFTGQLQVFISSVSGGTPPYSHQWYLDDAPILGATSPSWTYTPSSVGSHVIYLRMTDNTNATAVSNIASVQIIPPLPVIGGLAKSANTRGLQAPWLGAIFVLAAAAVLGGTIAKRKRRWVS